MSGKNELLSAQRPGGFLDFLPAEYLARQKMLNTIERTFTSYGFDAIETSIVEFRSVLEGEEGDTGKQIFSVVNREVHGEALALRFDHTIPFARLLAQNPYDAQSKKGVRLPWRRMVMGPVFRGERPQQGRYRQFYQFDADIAGTNEMIADAELITMMDHTMMALGVEHFVIRINNRKILNGLADIAGLKDQSDFLIADQTKILMRTLDKIDKIGIDEVISQLQVATEDKRSLALSDDAAKKVRSFLLISGTNEEKLTQCRTVFGDSAIAQEGIEELQEILTLLSSTGAAERVIVDFSIARGLDYYTGTVMETNLTDAPEFGSVFSGGRYDGLVRRFTGQDLPSVGASIGVDRLFAALVSLGKLDMYQKTKTNIVIMRIMHGHDDLYLDLAQRIRKAGHNVEISLLRDTTFAQQFSYALERGARHVIICGDNEFAQGVVQIKDTKTREQKEITLQDVTTYFQNITDAI